MRQHRVKIGVVFLIVFIDLVGFGIVIPFLPLYGEDFGPSPIVFGLLMASFSAMQFVFAPILGRLSDRYGRRPVLLISLAGSVVGYLLFAFAGSLAMLFASRIIDGISGGNISTAQAVIADITDERDRTKGMGILGAAFGLGFICGPGLAALLVGIARWLPGVAAAATSATAFVLVLRLLPETRQAQGDGGRRRHHPLSPRNLTRVTGFPLVASCLAVVFLVIFAFSNFETTFAQLLRLRFDLSMSSVGWMFVYAGVLGAVVQGGLVSRLAQRFGEPALIAFGAAVAGVAGAVLPFSGSLMRLLAVLAVLAVGHGLAAPSLSSFTSKLVPAGEVGGVMGVYQGVSSLARIVGPFWAEWAYGARGPAAPYLSAAAAYVVAGAVIAVGRRSVRACEPEL
jgi:DHA1 family tetracycline resistance protein-like MFS transporter